MTLYVGLLHHPVLDRGGKTITTAVTNLDVHDIARTCRTYGVAGFFLVTPIEAQRELITRILDHFRQGSGGRRVPDRAEAFGRCEVLPSASAVVESLRARGETPRTVATTARLDPERAVEPRTALSRWKASGRPTLLWFGTGHGMTREFIASCEEILAPIRPDADYNHLSVRAAVAILLDRLCGDQIDGKHEAC